MYQKGLLIWCVSLLTFTIFLLDCTRVSDRPCSPSTSLKVINVVINDSPGSDDYFGNNDGELNPNETVGLRLQLTNIGEVPIPASEGRIFSNQQGINILDSTAYIPEISVGDTVWALEEFSVMVDSSATDECAAFLLTLKTPQSGLIAEETSKQGTMECAMFCESIIYPINACIDKCEVVENNEDILVICLSIWNRSRDTSNKPIILSEVAAKIDENSFRSCSDSKALTVFAVNDADKIFLDKVFYGTIGGDTCGDPKACLKPGLSINTKEFRFKIEGPNKTKEKWSKYSCIRFTVEIWTGASRSGSDCIINLPKNAKRKQFIWCRIRD